MTIRIAIAAIAAVVIAIAIAAGSIWIAATEKHRNRDHCLSRGAQAVPTGGSRYLCVTTDGRVLP